MKPVVACCQNGFLEEVNWWLERWEDTGSECTPGAKSSLAGGRKR